MRCKYLIVGQGIAGTLLSFLLWKNNQSFIVIDETPQTPIASRVAGAVINPVNVNQWTAVSGYPSHLETALSIYHALEETLGLTLIRKMSMLVFPESDEDWHQFENRKDQLKDYIQESDDKEWAMAEKLFHFDYGMVKVAPVWKVNAIQLLSGWTGFLKCRGLLIGNHWDAKECEIQNNHIRYKGIEAERIVFCDGARGADNPYLSNLSFTRNRGEALLLSVPDLPMHNIYHHHLRLVPAEDGLFWCGSNYRWQFEDLLPDQEWRKETEKRLREWLTVSFETIDHQVAERPTTAGQHVFATCHPAIPSIAIFNGLGTKGFSQGPSWALNLYAQLVGG